MSEETDFVVCRSNEYMRIAPIVSMSFNTLSFISTSLVLISLLLKKRETTKIDSKQKLFSSLLQTSIFCLILTDLLTEMFYMPTLVINLASYSFEHVGKTLLTIIWIGSQLSESFVLGSGLWAFLISLCILICLRTTKTKDEDKDFYAEELKYRSIFVLIGWGFPLIHAVFWINTNLRFQAWPRSINEYFIGSLISNGYHSLSYVIIESASTIIRLLIFTQIRSVPIFDKKFQQKMRFILTKVLLYTLPFTVTCFFLTLQREYTDIERLVNLSTQKMVNIFCMSDVSFVFRSLHSVMFPLRGTMNALIYCVLSEWFLDKVKKFCFCRRELSIQKDDYESMNNFSLQVEASVPGYIHTDLYKASIIKDPYFRFNDVEYQHLKSKTQKIMYLIAEGIDTISVIKINGNIAGKTENQFRRYKFDVKNHLKVGLNHIEVTFYNTIEYSEHQKNLYPYKVPHDYHEFSNGEQNRNFIRKSQCSYSWDWGPSYPAQGIWKPIYILGLQKSVHLEEFVSKVYHTDGKFHIQVNVKLISENVKNVKIVLTMKNTKLEKEVELIDGSNDFKLVLHPEN
eukprot:gene9172-1259_t